MENIWDEKKQEFISKLEKACSVFDDIMNKDKNYMVISVEGRQKLKEQQSSAKKILDKLKKKEFTVAIVGKENSGKSTFGNALLKSNIMPMDSSRCTYTTTEIRAGATDNGIIEFYSKEEFYADFRKKLDQLRYPDISASFANLSEKAFDTHWNSMEVKEYAFFSDSKNVNLAKDIKTMLNGKELIHGLLGSPAHKYEGKENLYGSGSKEFQQYITGYGEPDANGVKSHTAHPYAVKGIFVQSTELGSMSNIVLYDVPGFDSPTALHETQTAKMLKEADAIIVVTEANNPSLTGPLLSMLHKGDADGVKLYEKSFIFGNKIDSSTEKDIAQYNRNVLVKDAVSNRIASEEHIIVGSAKAYMDSEAGKDSISKKIMDEWNMPYGIDELKQNLQDYYDNNRFEVMQKRAEKNLQDAREYLEEILDKNSIGNEFTGDLSDGKYYTKAVRDINIFIAETMKINSKYQNTIKKDLPFSRIVTENIEKIYPKVEVESELVNDIELASNVTVADIYPIIDVDTAIRKALHPKFTKAIVKQVHDVTIEKENMIKAELADKFLEVLGTNTSAPSYEDLKVSVLNEFEKLLDGNGSRCQFNTLVERFTTRLIEASILKPYASKERLDLLKERLCLPEFISLAAYYYTNTDADGEPEITTNEEVMQLFDKLICHKGLNKDASSEQEDNKAEREEENALRKCFEDYADDLAVDALPFNKWVKLADKYGVRFSKAASDDNLRKAIRVVLRRDNSVEAIEKAIKNYCQSASSNENYNKDNSKGFYAQLQIMHELSLKEENINGKEIDKRSKENDERNQLKKKHMIDVINNDIEVLRDITVNSVIKAIGLESAFISVINDNIQLIRDAADAGAMDKWIHKNLAIVKENEFMELYSEKANIEARKNIIETIRTILPELA